MTAHTIERWRTGSVSWPASVASPAREGNYCSSRLDTTGEPNISSVERGEAFLAGTPRGSESDYSRDLFLTRKRDPGPREGIAEEVGVRAGAAGVTPPEACHG